MSSKTKKWLSLVLVLVVMLLAGYVVYPKSPGINLNQLGIHYATPSKFRLGLDLQGGTQLVYQADLKNVAESQHKQAMEGVRDVIERRVNAYGVSEPQVSVYGDDRLSVELAGVKDVNEAIKMIGKTPLLEFKEEMNDQEKAAVDAQMKDSQIPEQYKQLLYYKNTELGGKQLERADVGYDQGTYQPQVNLQFNEDGKRLFNELTTRNVGRHIAIFLDGMPLTIPTVNEPIRDGRAVISGSFKPEEAQEIVRNLNSGALPVPINLLSQQTVDASLGKDSINKSLVAGLLGFLLVCVFMIIYYRLQGLLAVLALVGYSLIVLAIFKLIPVTLTLAGIAGFILSIGMAVDANVLIFERVKEELRRGKAIASAVEEGFDRAWSSIFDSNLTTLISCAVLAYFGTSFVKGFAITLSIGVLISMLSAILVTKIFLRTVLPWKKMQKPWLFGVGKDE